MTEADRPPGYHSDPDSAENEVGARLEVGMSRNSLLINGQLPKTDIEPEVLRWALTEGRPVILQGLEAYKAEMRKSYPNVRLAPIRAVDLGLMQDKNLSKLGMSLARDGTQVMTTPDVLRDDLKPLWQVVEESGYVPSVRAFYQYSGYWIGLWAELPSQ